MIRIISRFAEPALALPRSVKRVMVLALDQEAPAPAMVVIAKEIGATVAKAVSFED